MLKRKTLRRDEWPEIVKKSIGVYPASTPDFYGTAALLAIGRMETPFSVGGTLLADEGWHWLELAPREEHWWLTSMFDPQGTLVESYFDITLENDFSDPQNPSFLDLFLDVAVPAGGKPVLLDEDELAAALLSGEITPAQAALARKTARRLIAWHSAHGDDYTQRLTALYRLLREREK